MIEVSVKISNILIKESGSKKKMIIKFGSKVNDSYDPYKLKKVLFSVKNHPVRCFLKRADVDFEGILKCINITSANNSAVLNLVFETDYLQKLGTSTDKLKQLYRFVGSVSKEYDDLEIEEVQPELIKVEDIENTELNVEEYDEENEDEEVVNG